MIPLPFSNWLRLFGVAAACCVSAAGGEAVLRTDGQVLERLDSLDVEWTERGSSSLDSMPIGNGDVAANVWVEANGDLVLTVSKSDAWSENPQASDGLLKLGRVRVRLGGGLPSATFRQRLRLRDGAVEIEAGAAADRVAMRVWADANAPVIRVDVSSARPVRLEAGFESMRTPEEIAKRPPEGYTRPVSGLHADHVFDDHAGALAWCYRNRNEKIPELKGLTFGCVVTGANLDKRDAHTLKSRGADTRHSLSIVAETRRTAGEREWLDRISETARAVAATNRDIAWEKHAGWWRAFWLRGWVFISGDADAETLTRAYSLQRYMTACASRGAFPVKFNGSLFTLDYPLKDGVRQADRSVAPFEVTVNGDFRRWGGYYWFQNTRLIYWPMFAAGDFDLFEPFAGMYRTILEKNAREVATMYGFRDATYFQETTSPFGGVGKVTHDMPGRHTRHYFTCSVEFAAMALEYWRHTRDADFARGTLVPAADGILQFFFQYYGRDEQGRLLIDPHNAGETFHKVKNPAPETAGLAWLLAGLAELPDDLVSPEQRATWKTMASRIPPIARGEKNGRHVVLAAEDLRDAKRENTENPELYTVFPFRVFGVAAGEVELARETYHARDIKRSGCWYQDPIHAAYAGLADEARREVVGVAAGKDPKCKFPGFWQPGHDYTPDMDHGGVMQTAVQAMLLQTAGEQIHLLPAWPADWDVEFRLHAPGGAVVTASVKNARVEALRISPDSRRADVVLPKPFQP